MDVRLIFLSFFKIPTEGRRLNGKRAAGMARCLLLAFRVVKCARFNGERRLDNLIWKLSAKRPRKASKGYV